ncbi:hypothetical protein CAL29_14995 [Bordetella genomosp. 10]|uniref:Uncharacterized protein n=1 Tax=Bordetella genomosp. 10 TaxID=1416804 RepID=A0A261SBK2_9BORD|nr:hypothetical protein [Bordetella genomosp. 10]OZI34774.1 hypothetical protein CAL29_14995 [Bordetella genomosp. 10]
MKSANTESYDIACLASMLIHFLTTVGVSRDEAIEVLRAAEDMLPAASKPVAVKPAVTRKHEPVEALAVAL